MSDTISAECQPDVKASHTRCARYNGYDRNAADASEHTIHTRGEQRFPLTIEAVGVRHPTSEKPLHKQMAFGPRFCSQGVKSRR